MASLDFARARCTLSCAPVICEAVVHETWGKPTMVMSTSMDFPIPSLLPQLYTLDGKFDWWLKAKVAFVLLQCNLRLQVEHSLLSLGAAPGVGKSRKTSPGNQRQVLYGQSKCSIPVGTFKPPGSCTWETTPSSEPPIQTTN